MSSFHTRQINKTRPIKTNNLIKPKITIVKDESLINILIRTTYRPEFFKQCVTSILNQNYKNFRIICCYDDERCLEYLKDYDDQIDYSFIDIESSASHKYNLYCNNLMDKVDDGWIMFLDDDDKFTHLDSLKIINNKLNNINDILFWQVNINGKLIIPSDINNIKKFSISSIGFCFHSKFKDLSRWESIICGDFHFITSLLKKNKFNRLKLPLTLTSVNHNNNTGNYGIQHEYDFKDFIKNKNIKQIHLSKPLLHLKDKMKEYFDLEEYSDENDICVFFGTYMDDDLVKIKNHQGQKFVMFEGNDIKKYEIVPAVNFLTMTKLMKDYLIEYKIFSRLINLDLK